jgi:hypothetical protein
MSTGLDDYVIARGAAAEEVNGLPRVQITPELAPEAYHGVIGRIVKLIEPETEAHPAALLINFLLGAGNSMGRNPHTKVGHTVHCPNDFAILVGPTSTGGKGMSWSSPREILSRVDPEWGRHCVKEGLSTGEGLIYHVRDAREEKRPVRDKGKIVDYQMELVDEGVTDKRAMVIEQEFARTLRTMGREGNNLSPVIRRAWDDGDLESLIKNSPNRATGAHISIIGHITQQELARVLTDSEHFNGFANRFLFLSVWRVRSLPEGGEMPEGALAPLVRELTDAIQWASATPRLFERDEDAKDYWKLIYPYLRNTGDGLTGAILARGTAHVLRLSLLYAALDKSALIRREHLTAAVAVWEYCETSARQIFGDRLGILVADRIWEVVQVRGEMDRTEISGLFNGHMPATTIDAGLELLRARGSIRREHRPAVGGKGRPREVWICA